MTVKKRIHNVGFFICCLALNLGGRCLADFLHLPIWMDMTGTCVASYELGLLWGIFAAILNNLIFSTLNNSAAVYAITGAVCAVVMDLCIKRGFMEKLYKAMFMSFWIGLFSVVVSTPLNLIFYDGYSGNIWGDALVNMLRWYGASDITSAIMGEIVVEIMDKQFCVLLSIIVIYIIKNIREKRKKKNAISKEIAGMLVISVLITSIGMLPLTVQAEEKNIQSEYTSRIYNNQNGLMSSDANVIEETADGYIWIGSYAGLTRFDGTEFEFIREGGITNVTSMLCDSKGRLWIGTNDSGVACYQNGKFSFYKTEDGLSADSIREFCEGFSGEIYVATTDHVCVIEPDGRINVLNDKLSYVQSMSIYEKMLVCVTNDGGIYALSNGKIVASYHKDTDNIFFNCVENTGLGLLAGTADKEIYSLCITEDTIALDKKLSLPIQNIHFMQETDKEYIWVCGDNGFGYYQNEIFHKWNIPEFSASIEDVHEDYQGNVWVASSRYGVLCLSKTPFYNIFAGNGIDGAICNAVLPYQGGYLVGTDYGLVYIDSDGNNIKNDLTNLLNGARIRSLMTDSQGNTWICTYSEHGLLEVKSNGEVVSYTKANNPVIPSDRARCITELKDGTVAVGTADGIYFLQNGDVTGTITQKDGLANSQILSLVQGSDGILYAGSDGAGLFLIKDQILTGNYTKKDGLSSDVILRIVPSEYGLLLVTSNSLCLLDEHITILTEFPYYNNYDILIDHKTAYVLSSAGVFVTNLDNLCKNNVDSNILYDAKHGLKSAITANSWNYIGTDHQLYICCNDGVVSFDTEVTADQNYYYGIKSIVCDGENIGVNGNEIRIPGKTKEIILSASLRNYALTDAKIRFFVEGTENDSTVISSDELGALRMINPEAGKYQVHLQLYDISGKRILEEQVYTLVKEKQMWEQRWYKIYLIFMTVEITCYIIWTFVLVLDDRRKKKMLAELRVKEERELVLSQTVVALAKTVDAKDHYTSGHSERVGKYAKMLAARMGKSEYEQERIYRAGLLHDVGKIRVPEMIINKPGRLTDEEFQVIKQHPTAGYHILGEITADCGLAEAARFHHERYDGKGYPTGLKGEQIPEIARIVGVADAYDAMTSNRSYRSALSQEIVRGEIEKGKGLQFDPEIADLMLQIIDEDTEYALKV